MEGSKVVHIWVKTLCIFESEFSDSEDKNALYFMGKIWKFLPANTASLSHLGHIPLTGQPIRTQEAQRDAPVAVS